MEVVYIIVAAAVSLIAGFVLSRVLVSKGASKKEKEAEEKARMIIKEAEIKQESIKKEKILEAKEKYMRMKNDFENEVNNRKSQVVEDEKRIQQKQKELQSLEQSITDKNKKVEELQESLKAQLDILNRKREEVEKERASQVSKLEKLANMSAEEAKQLMMENLQAEAKTKAASLIKDIEEEARLTATKKAKKVVIETIQRTAAEHAIENSVSIFNLDNDDLKGKIIGREGRNIRTLEQATGVEIIVDDTPEAIIISGFDPVRREIAKLSLHRLVADGRIHPARIEEIVAKTTKDIEEEIVEIGEKTVIELNIHGVHPELIKLVGRMRFRSSYGQNLLQHSKEVAKLCANMASELGLNVKLAKRAGLLHDIGKVYTEDTEKPHAIVGMELAQKHNENPEVCNAIGAHHDEIEMTSLLSPIVQSCGAISGSRPGARREVIESYMQRLKDLENLALSFEGVLKCYAMQAGRELRIMVDAENVTDEKADLLSFEISKKIEEEMQYPGQIKITVIREKRAINFAK